MIYLDNAATTKPCEKAAEAMMQAVTEFANPSSLHGAGLRAEKLVTAARENIAKTTNTHGFKGLIFVSISNKNKAAEDKKQL